MGNRTGPVVDEKTTDHYGYILDPEVAMVQLFHWTRGATRALTGRNLQQIVWDGQRFLFLERRTLSASEHRLLHEAGRPPVDLPEDAGLYRGQSKEPCLFCGKQGVPIGLITSFSLPLYQPRGHTCQFCGKTVVTLD